MRTLPARLSAILLLTAPVSAAHAQIGASRDSIVLDASRGRETELVVWNTGATELEASVRVVDRAARKFNDAPASREASGCAQVVSVSPRNIRLGPGEQRTLRITLDSAALHRPCLASAIVQPTRIASRPLSTERTVPRAASILLFVFPGTRGDETGTTSSAPSPGATPSRRAW